MNIVLKLGAITAASLVLWSCQTLTKEECVVTDWADLGQKDGNAGYPPVRLERHTKACEKAGIVPDRIAWTNGWRAGISQYCKPSNGLSVGRRGNSYRNSCPADLEGPFLTAYRAGYNVNQAERRIKTAERRIDSLTNEAFEQEVSEERRSELRSDLRSARLDLDRARFDLQRAEAEYRRVSASVGL